MFRFYFPLLLTTTAIVVSQYLQKMVPRQVHPLAALMVIYGLAFLVSLGLFLLIPGRPSLGAALGEVSWASYALGGVILGLESGSILAYRVGWKVGTYALVVNASSSILLLPLGLLIFREKLSSANWVGVLFCLAGLVLLSRK